MNIRRYIVGFIAFIWTFLASHAQVVRVSPENPTADDEVTIIFDASEGNQALKDYEGTVYAHTGVIIGTADQPSGWRYVQGEWGKDDRRMRMIPMGDNKYRISYHIRSFYGIPQNEPFLQLSFVFRNQNGSLVAKETGEKDIYYPEIEVFEHGPLEKANGADGLTLGELQSLEALQDGSLLLSDGKQALHIQSYGSQILNISYFPKGHPERLPSEAVVLEPGTSNFSIQNDEGLPYITIPLYATYTLRINRNPIRLEVFDGEKQLLGDAEGGFYDAADNMIGPVTGVRLHLKPGEHLYGTGSRALNIDRRGQRLYAYNTASYGYTLGEDALNISIPFILSSEDYALYFDSYRRGYFDLGKTTQDVLEFGVKDTVLSYFLILGKNPEEIVKRYTLLTGRQPMPPMWAMGYIQSRYGYKSQEEALDIVNQTLEAGFPLDAYLLDLYWFGGKERMGDFDWDRKQFPDPEGMIRQLNTRGVNTILISETYFVEGTRYYNEARSKGFLTKDAAGKSYLIPDFWAGPAGLLDVFQPGVADWFWPLYKQQLDKGVAGWWCDSGEPENHPANMVHANGSAESVHNLYPFQWSKILYEKHRETYPQRRLFNLMRSGFAGMQRYSTFPWSGDVFRSWDAFRAQPMIMLGSGISGIGYMHSDLGGFTGGPKDAELYQRWLQMGTFTPIMRVHGDAEGIAPEPIFWDQTTQDIARAAIQLRYRLLPYNYTLAWENSTLGHPLARPMFYHYPEDPNTGKLDDQYLWGENLLVAPVFEKGQMSRKVYLPAGTWTDFHTDKKYMGGDWREIPVVEEHIPVFVKAGALIPTTPALPNTRAYDGSRINIAYYPDLQQPVSKGLIYLDDGQTAEAYAKNAFRLITMEASVSNKLLTLKLAASGNGYNNNPPVSELEVKIKGVSKPPKKIRLGNQTLKVSLLQPDATAGEGSTYAYWDRNEQQIVIRFRWNRDHILIQMKRIQLQ